MTRFRASSRRLVLLGLLLICTVVGYAQTGYARGEELPQVELDNLVQGRLYVPDYEGVQGSQYLTESWLPGNIVFLEGAYQGLPFRYDIFADVLIFLHRTEGGLFKIQLTKEFIQYFTLGGRYFINLEYSSYRDTGLKAGFYEVIYEDRITLLAKRNVDLVTEDAVTFFSPKHSWFLVKDGTLHRIRNKKNLFAAFDENDKKSISTFLRKQAIRLRTADDVQWLQVAVHLNSLLQS